MHLEKSHGKKIKHSATMLRSLNVKSLKPHITCVLCGGYLVDAHTITECLHSFCRKCIVQWSEKNYHCPVCKTEIHKTRPLLNVRPDHVLQDIVTKLLPEDSIQAKKGMPTNLVSILLHYYVKNALVIPVFPVRYLRCSPRITIKALKKFLLLKFCIPETHEVEIIRSDEILPEHLTIKQIARIYGLEIDKTNVDLQYVFISKYEDEELQSSRSSTQPFAQQITLPQQPSKEHQHEEQKEAIQGRPTTQGTPDCHLQHPNEQPPTEQPEDQGKLVQHQQPQQQHEQQNQQQLQQQVHQQELQQHQNKRQLTSQNTSYPDLQNQNKKRQRNQQEQMQQQQQLQQEQQQQCLQIQQQHLQQQHNQQQHPQGQVTLRNNPHLHNYYQQLLDYRQQGQRQGHIRRLSTFPKTFHEYLQYYYHQQRYQHSLRLPQQLQHHQQLQQKPPYYYDRQQIHQLLQKQRQIQLMFQQQQQQMQQLMQQQIQQLQQQQQKEKTQQYNQIQQQKQLQQQIQQQQHQQQQIQQQQLQPQQQQHQQIQQQQQQPQVQQPIQSQQPQRHQLQQPQQQHQKQQPQQQQQPQIKKQKQIKQDQEQELPQQQPQRQEQQIQHDSREQKKSCEDHTKQTKTTAKHQQHNTLDLQKNKRKIGRPRKVDRETLSTNGYRSKVCKVEAPVTLNPPNDSEIQQGPLSSIQIRHTK